MTAVLDGKEDVFAVTGCGFSLGIGNTALLPCYKEERAINRRASIAFYTRSLSNFLDIKGQLSALAQALVPVGRG